MSSSQRPYLLRAMHEWIADNGMTPHLLVDAALPGVRVPPQSVKDGKVVLNIAARGFPA
jgi:stringent starvation protein B